MDQKLRRLARTWVITLIALMVTLPAFNLLMDPYLRFEMPRIDGFNARKPAFLFQERFMKVHDVLRAAPNTLIMGSSPNDEGMDALDPAWPAHVRPVYNLSFMGGTPYMSFRYLQHTMAHRPISLVVLGLTVDAFLTSSLAERPKDPEFELRLAVKADGSPNPAQARQNARDLIQSITSLNAFTDSIATLAANLKGDSFNTVAGNLELSSDRLKVWGTYRSFLGANVWGVRSLRDKQQSQYDIAMNDLRAILRLCRSQGTRVILVINPVHADQLELFDHLGYWTAFEDWKRELITLAEEYSHNGSLIPLWDFSGYDAYSTESVPLDGHEMHWYTDSIHYSRAMGTAVVARIFGSGDPDFGALLTRENLDAHFAMIREQQVQYRTRHPADVRRARDQYKAAMSLPFYLKAKVQ